MNSSQIDNQQKLVDDPDNFSEIFEKALSLLDMRPGSIVQAKVLGFEKEFVLLDVGLKSEAVVPIEEFKDSEGEVSVSIGDEVQVAIEFAENGYGETVVSREKAKRLEAWKRLEQAFENGEVVTGVISGRVKGGFTVELGDLRGFLPGSLVDVRPLKDTSHLEGCPLELKILKLDQERNNVVVSRRAVLSSDQMEEREKLLAQLKEGLVLKGVVKNLTDYGAFIDLGGLDGLLHITDMAWWRVRHPSEILAVGDEVKAQVLKFDPEKMRVSLGLKQLTEDPWEKLTAKYTKGMKVKGRVSNFIEYGGFIALEPGVEGLVHVSEMDWSNKNVHPSKVFQIGEEVEVMILDIDHKRRRISLGLKQCKENPWKRFSEQYERGSVLEGEVNSLTDFGIFLSLEGGIDGLVHISDLSWKESPEVALKQYTKGDRLKVVVLQVDVARERISLGVKQLEESPAALYLKENPVGTKVKGTFVDVDQEKKLARLDLAPFVVGVYPSHLLKGSEKEGDVVEGFVQEVTKVQGKQGPVILLAQEARKSHQVEQGGAEKASSEATAKKKPVVEEPLNAMEEAFRLAASRDESEK